MKSKRTIGVVVVIILVAIVYVGYREVKKRSIEPSKDEHSVIDSTTNLNHEKTPVGMGAKPAIDPKDGSVKIVEDFIKANAKNPSSFEFLEWSDILMEDGYWKVRCKYRGISSFDAEVTTTAWFYIKNDKVIYSKIISKI